MMRHESETLLKICRQRERVAKTETGTVAAARKADFEQQTRQGVHFRRGCRMEAGD